MALYDLTPFSKFYIEGPEAEYELQRLIAADIAVEPGRTVYGQMLNRNGGIEADVTVMRRDEEHFWIIGGAPTRIKDHTWIARHLRDDAHITLTDQTDDYAVLGVMGPNARLLLSRVCHADLSNDAFAFSTCNELVIGTVSVFANRLSYVGELGWELYIPREHALGVYDVLISSSVDLGLVNAGMFALDSCRLEKGYRHWGHDMGPEDTPIDVGLGFAVAYEKDVEFTGRDAMLRKRDAGSDRRLVLFHVEGEPLILHDEPVYRNGRLVGQTTSGGRAFRTGGSLAFAMITAPETISKDWIDAGEFTIKIAGDLHAAIPLHRPPYDPKSMRLKS